MRTILVPNPALERTPGYEATVPLGVLSLASALPADLPGQLSISDPRDSDFSTPRQQAHRLLRERPDVVGFSTMCNTYPWALRTAQLVKRARPATVVVFGGPHATAVAQSTLESFDFVDFVLRGECERTFPQFLRAIGSGARELRGVPGLVYRRQGRVMPGPPPADRLAAADLPDIDYALLRDLHEFRDVPLDVGRGCPFACTFCSTSTFWRRRYRLRDPDDVVDVVRRLQARHGVKAFRFVHDNFTAVRSHVVEFCTRIIAEGVEFDWRCSGRPDSLDDELIDLMARAGCRSVFMGIESGSSRIQEASRKRLRLPRTLPLIRALSARRISVTASFVTGFPYEEEDDLDATLTLMSGINHEARGAAHLQLHLLTPIPGAPLLEEDGVTLAFDPETLRGNGARLDPTMKSWIAHVGAPVFSSFYHFPTPGIERSKLLAARAGWLGVFSRLRMTAMVLEEARRTGALRLVDVFAGAKLPGTSGDARMFRWCVGALRKYLARRSSPWSDAALAVLELEVRVFEQRNSGGERRVTSPFAVYEWIEHACTAATGIGFPERAARAYLLSGEGSEVTIAPVLIDEPVRPGARPSPVKQTGA